MSTPNAADGDRPAAAVPAADDAADGADVRYAGSAWRAWSVVASLWVVALLNYLDRLMVTTMRDSLREDIAMTDAEFGLLTSVFLWVYAVLSPPAGYLADRFGRSRVIVVSLAVWSLVTWMTTLATSFTGLLVARALMGVSEACYLPAALALIADYHRGPTRSLATGIHLTGLVLGMAMGGVGGSLAEAHGWRMSFMIFGAFGVAYAVGLAATLRDAPRAAAAKTDRPTGLFAGIATLIVEPAFLVLLTVFVLFSFVNWGLLHWLPTYLREQFQLSQTAAGWTATTYPQIGGMAGILLGGYWADRWSRTNARGRMLVPFVGTVLAGPCIVAAGAAGVLPLAIVGLALYGMGRSMCDPNWMPILCQIADPRYRATGYGLMNFFTCLLGGLSAYGIGLLKDRGVELSSTFIALGVVFFAGSWLFLFIRPKRA